MQLHQADGERAGLGISMSWLDRQKELRPLDETTEPLARGMSAKPRRTRADVKQSRRVDRAGFYRCARSG
jgi:hypothetical protein